MTILSSTTDFGLTNGFVGVMKGVIYGIAPDVKIVDISHLISAQNVLEGAYAMDLTMRFIPTFSRDFQLTMDAQRARGYELEKLSGGLIEQVRKMGPIFVPVTIHAIIGSEDIIDAMDLRAFGVGPRTWLDKLDRDFKDRVLIWSGVAILVGSILLGAAGYGNFWVPDALLQLAGN